MIKLILILSLLNNLFAKSIDNLNNQDYNMWSKATGWKNGGSFANSWDSNQINFDKGKMYITLKDINGTLFSGEYRSNETFGYGYYEVSLKTSNTKGVINAFFIYSGLLKETKNDEIDMEIKGDNPDELQVNYWTNGIEHPTVINLGFDSSSEFHKYGFKWTKDSIEWFVDSKLIHTENGGKGILSTNPGKLMINLWATIGVPEWSSNYVRSNGIAELSVDYIYLDPFLNY